MTTPNILPYQPTASPPSFASSPTDRIHRPGKLRSFFESVRQDDSSNSSLSKPGHGNSNHRSAHHHRGGGFGGGPNQIGPGPPPPNLHQEYERIMGKKPMSPRTLHAAEAAALALDPAARMAHNQQQRVHTVPSRSPLVKSQFGSSIPNLQSIYPATRSSILASGPGLAGAGPQSAKGGKGKGPRSRSGSNNSSVGGRSRQGAGANGSRRHSRHPSTDSISYQQHQPSVPYPAMPYQQQQQQQAPIWMSNSPPPLAPSVANKIRSANQSRSNSLNRQPAAVTSASGGQQGGYMYPASAPVQNWQQQPQQPYYPQQQQYMMQQHPGQQQQQMMYQPSSSPQPVPAQASPLKKSAPKSKQTKQPPSSYAPTQPPAPGQPASQPSATLSKRPKRPTSCSPPPGPPPASQETPTATQKPPRPPPPEGFVACSICGRSFAPDRVAKHETVCAKMANSKRAPVDMSQVRKELIARDNSGRKQHGGGGFG